MKKKPELLSPAGNFEKMKAVILYGADAVYLSGQAFGMRAAADNFSLEELAEAVTYAHERGVRVYLTVNTMPREYQYEALKEYFLALRDIRPDALIVGSIGVLSLARKMLPEIELHISTQASAVSSEDCLAWQALGAKRVVLSRELSLSDTHFTNPHGLDDKEHYTTATELAKIAAAALENPTLKKILSTYKKTFSTETRTRTYVNHNKLLRLYDGAVGVKTGFTKHSGRCLVGAAERDDLTLISVTLDAPDDWRDHKAMLDYGYEKIEKVIFALPYENSYEVSVLGKECKSTTVTNTEGASLILPRCERDITKHVKLPRIIPTPVKAGDILGEVIYSMDGEAVARVKLVATENVSDATEKSFIKRIFTSIFGQKG